MIEENIFRIFQMFLGALYVVAWFGTATIDGPVMIPFATIAVGGLAGIAAFFILLFGNIDGTRTGSQHVRASVRWASMFLLGASLAGGVILGHFVHGILALTAIPGAFAAGFMAGRVLREAWTDQ